MNRLTKRGKHGTALVAETLRNHAENNPRPIPREMYWCEVTELGTFLHQCNVGKYLDRLAAYEDLGFDPDEIKEIIAQRDRLKRIVTGDGSWSDDGI